ARGLGPRTAGARQRAVRRAEGAMYSQRRRPLLRELRRVLRGALLARVERSAARTARSERPRILQSELRLAGHRTEVPRHVRATGEAAAVAIDRAASRMVRPAEGRPGAGRGTPPRDSLRGRRPPA